MKFLFLLICLGMMVNAAEAQQAGGINYTPGQPPTFITPTVDGSSGMIRPSWFGYPRNDITVTQFGIYVPVPLASAPPASALTSTPYGIVMPGHPSILDRPLAPYGITLPSAGTLTTP